MKVDWLTSGNDELEVTTDVALLEDTVPPFCVVDEEEAEPRD